MSWQQPNKKVPFSQVAFKGWLKYLLIIGLVLIILGPVVYGVLGSMKPINKSATGKAGNIAVDISDLASQPININCSHTWVVTPLGNTYTSNGLPVVFYSITVTDKNGNVVLKQNDSIELPIYIWVHGTEPQDHLESSEVQAKLSPGPYDVAFTATDTITCTMIQKYEYQDAMVGMILIALIGVIVVALWVLLGLRATRQTPLSTQKADQPTYQQPQPQVNQPSYYSKLYSSQGLQPVTNPQTQPALVPPPSSYSYPSSYRSSSNELITPGQPQDQDPSRTNLEYRQGGYFTELVCSYCHRSVRSQPIDGVVTCESCGEKARLY
jgi:hypothetical protein